MRLLNILIFAWALGILGLVQNFFRRMLDFPSALAGIILAVLLGYIAVSRSFRLGKRGVFIDIMNRYERNIMFFVAFPLIILGGITLFVIAKVYFPGYNISKGTSAALSTFLFVFSSIGVVGTYCLERRYGKKAYLGKRKNKRPH
jgi:hypothetical protein